MWILDGIGAPRNYASEWLPMESSIYAPIALGTPISRCLLDDSKEALFTNLEIKYKRQILLLAIGICKLAP